MKLYGPTTYKVQAPSPDCIRVIVSGKDHIIDIIEWPAKITESPLRSDLFAKFGHKGIFQYQDTPITVEADWPVDFGRATNPIALLRKAIEQRPAPQRGQEQE